jgi:hypothetical protein
MMGLLSKFVSFSIREAENSGKDAVAYEHQEYRSVEPSYG